jgi:hypothetical protein
VGALVAVGSGSPPPHAAAINAAALNRAMMMIILFFTGVPSHTKQLAPEGRMLI